MAPVEFEKHIKEKLEERRIKASSRSWDEISARLGEVNVRKRPFYYRYAVAALLAGILVSVVWIFRDSTRSEIDEQPLVNGPMNEKPESDIIEEQLIPSPSSTVVIFEVNETDKEESVLAEANEQTSESAYSSPEIVNIPSEIPDKAIVNDPDILIDAKVTEVAAQVELMERRNEVVTDAEVDSLLRNAQRELMADRKFREGQEVDASSLLAGVEEEINKSFRDQVFEKLKQGFVKVRTAVADRNK